MRCRNRPQSNGYCLALAAGRPVFTVVADRQPTRVAAKDAVTGRWTTVRAGYAAESAWLLVDGQRVGQAKPKAALRREPNDTLQIGADLGSQVLEAPLPKFQGSIESVRISSGEPSDRR